MKNMMMEGQSRRVFWERNKRIDRGQNKPPTNFQVLGERGREKRRRRKKIIG